MRKIIRFIRRLRADGMPVWNDRVTIAKEGRRLIHEGPDRYRNADRSSKITIVVVVAITIAIIALVAI